MATNYSPTIVTDGIVGNWDPKAREYPPRGLATTWTDYNSQSANYTILGDDGIILKDTSASWIGYFPATLTSLGGYTVTFDVVADVAASSFVVNNDGTSNNAFLKTISVGTTLTRITLKGTITSISSPVCQVFLRRNSGGNITITNFRLFESGPWLYDGAGGSDGRGSGNNGLMHNGTCLSFDGTDDRIELDDLDSQFSDYFTLSVWLRPLDVTGETWVFAGENGGGIGFYIRQSNDDLIFRHNGIGDGTTNVTAFFSYSEANQAAPVSTAWIHCVFNWDGVNTNVYRDGVRVGGEAATGTLAADAFNDPRIGDDSAAGDREWYGEMADFRLYNVALSASQVTEIYNDSKVIIPSNVSQTNLIVWYPMTEGAGDLVYDGSGKGYTGTFSNAPTWTTAQTGCPQLVEGYNRPITFNVDASSTDYVDTGDVYAADEMTLVAWVNMSVVPSAAASSYPMLFGKRGTDTQRSYFLAFNAANKLYWEIKDAAAVYYVQKSTKTDWNANQWYHIAVNYVASTGIAKMYIDGVEDAGTFSPAQPWSLDPIPDTSATCRIGGGYYWFEGIINEAAIYNKALGATDIAALAATDANGGPLPPDLMTMSYSTSSTSSSNVIGYWRNDNNVTWTDLSGNGKTGTVSGSPPSLLFKQGINGQKNVNTGRDNQGFPLKFKNVGAIGFNGSDSYVTIPNSTAVNFGSGNFTLAAWVKLADYTNGTPMAILHKQSGGTRYYMMWRGDVGNYIQVAIDGDTGSNLDIASGAMSNNNWNYVVATIDRATPQHKIYINGTQSGSTSTGNTTGSLTTTVPLIIGMNSTSTANQWDGQIANAQLYNRALSYAEIQQNYNAQKSRFT